MELLDLPDSLLLHILSFLSPKSIVRTGRCCKTLRRISQDNILWKNIFHSHFRLSSIFQHPLVNQNWCSEFGRLVNEIPVIETQVIDEPLGNGIWYVSFSHDGTRLGTCFENAAVQMWNTQVHPISMIVEQSMRRFGWQWSWYPQFSPSDEYLLASGVIRGSNGGEIAIFGTTDLRLLYRVPNNRETYIPGIWSSPSSFLSFTCDDSSGHMICQVVMNQIEISDSLERQQLFKFKSLPDATLSLIVLANFRVPSNILEDAKKIADQKLTLSTPTSQIGVENSDIFYSEDYFQNKLNYSSKDNTSTSTSLKETDQWLIFAVGTETNMQHQVGFKKFKNTTKLETTTHLTGPFDEIDLLWNFHGYVVGLAVSPDNENLYVNCRPWPDETKKLNPSDPPPISIHSDIHVIHLPTLTRVGKTCRPHNTFLHGPQSRIYIYIGASLHYFWSGSKGYGGPVDVHGYLWDHYYGLCLVKLPHENHVSCLAMKRTENDEPPPQILISVAHDKKIRVWRSIQECRRLGIDTKDLNQGTLLHPSGD